MRGVFRAGHVTRLLRGVAPCAALAWLASPSGSGQGPNGSSGANANANAITGAIKARFVGRHVSEPDGGVRFAWPGSGVVGRFEGTSVGARIKDEGFNLFEVVVDGEVKKVLRTEVKKDVFVLAEGLPPG